MPKAKSTTKKAKTTIKKTTKSDSGYNLEFFDLDIAEIKSKLIETFKSESCFDGDMILPSGRIASKYLDLKESLLSAEANVLAGMAVLHHIKEDVESVGGYRSGAYALATGASQLAYIKGRTLNSFFLRGQPRQYGYSKWIEGPLKQGSKVCIVQDFVLDGVEIIDTIRKVQEESRSQIIQVIGLVDRQDGAKERLEELGIDYTAICNFDDVITDDLAQEIAGMRR